MLLQSSCCAHVECSEVLALITSDVITAKAGGAISLQSGSKVLALSARRVEQCCTGLRPPTGSQLLRYQQLFACAQVTSYDQAVHTNELTAQLVAAPVTIAEPAHRLKVLPSLAPLKTKLPPDDKCEPPAGSKHPLSSSGPSQSAKRVHSDTACIQTGLV